MTAVKAPLTGDGPGRRTRAAGAVQATEGHATPPLAWRIPPAVCSCGVMHKSWRAVATCLRPWAVEVSGAGLWCYVHKMLVPRERRAREHLELYATQREAYTAKQRCVTEPCCGSCHRAQMAGKASFYVDLREHLEVAA
ncbi:MAG TPA: hypothetical protein VIT65_15600 [Microlunatus sp.]